MHKVVAGYAGLGAGCAYLLSRPGHEAYDIDTAHARWAQIQERSERLVLPSAYSLNSWDDLRYRFKPSAAKKRAVAVGVGEGEEEEEDDDDNEEDDDESECRVSSARRRACLPPSRRCVSMSARRGDG